MPPEITHFLDHLGHVIDNTKAPDWAEVLFLGGLAYTGAKYTGRIEGALLPVMGYKLATGPGGTPPVSQMAGITMLTGFGLAVAMPGIIEYFQTEIARTVMDGTYKTDPLTGKILPELKLKTIPAQYTPFASCPFGYALKVGPGGAQVCQEEYEGSGG